MLIVCSSIGDIATSIQAQIIAASLSDGSHAPTSQSATVKPNTVRAQQRNHDVEGQPQSAFLSTTAPLHDAWDTQGEPVPPTRTEPVSRFSAFDLWLNARPRLASARDHILSLRIAVKKERARYTQLETLLEDVTNQFMLILNAAATGGGVFLNYREELHGLRDRIQTCREDLKKQREKMAAHEDILSSKEYNLTELENEIYQDLIRDLPDEATATGPENTGPSIDTPATTAVPEANTSIMLRDELYSRMGDLQILLERLTNFEDELRQELDERDFLRGSEQPDLTPDEVFFEERRRERKDLEEEVEKVQFDVIRLRKTCQAQSIVFEDVQFPEPLFEPHFLELSASGRSGQLDAPLPPPEQIKAPSQKSGSSSVITTYYNTRDRVKRWLGEPLKIDDTRRPISEEEENDLLSASMSLDSGPRSGLRRPSSMMRREIQSALANMPVFVPPDMGAVPSAPSSVGKRVSRRASDNWLHGDTP